MMNYVIYFPNREKIICIYISFLLLQPYQNGNMYIIWMKKNVKKLPNLSVQSKYSVESISKHYVD